MVNECKVTMGSPVLFYSQILIQLSYHKLLCVSTILSTGYGHSVGNLNFFKATPVFCNRNLAWVYNICSTALGKKFVVIFQICAIS